MNSYQAELLSRRVEKILPSKDGLENLLSQKKKIRLYQGFDPTGFRLHLGHSIGLRKLMEFAQLGHEVIFLFGTGTVLVGDPSQRDTGRKLISQSDIDENIKDWQNQVAPLVDFDKVTIKQNGEWLTPLKLKDIVNIASNISAVQLFKRESFSRRVNRGDTVWYHETMYPLLQGYDSVVMDVDLEIGGTDQEFNMLIGRELQRKMNNHEKYVLTVPMIMGTDGKQMSKSSGNCVWLNDTPNDMFTKLMAINDDQIVPYFTLVTTTPMDRITQIDHALTANELHPIEAKKELARSIVTEFHSQEEAQTAQNFFESAYQKKDLNALVIDSSDEIHVRQTETTILDLLKNANLGLSTAQVKRTIEQGGVELNAQKITNPLSMLKLQSGDTLKFGKHIFKKVIINQ